jgi:ArpU family phage transcriptional regulator
MQLNQSIMQEWIIKLDQDATRQRVEGALETARIYKHLGFIRREMNVTANYGPRYGSAGEVSKAAENAAVWNVDQDERNNKQLENIERAVKRLPRKQQEIINLKYLSSMEEAFDYNVCGEVHMSERSYSRAKTAALFSLAFALRLEVWEEKNDGV